MNKFVHLHNHSEFSKFDGLNKMADWVLYARKMGFKSLALTDHGNVGGWIKFYQECKRKKDKKEQEIPYDPIKPIFGQEVYLSKNHAARGNKEQVDSRKGNRHLLLLAKNREGYENLCKLSQVAFTEGQAFGDARIDLHQLAEHSKGIICSSACLSSVINNNLLMDRYAQAKAAATLLKDIFGEDFHLEVMYHGMDDEAKIIPDVLKLGKELDVHIHSSNDCHYCRQEQARSQELLMAMSMSRCLKDPKAYHFPYDEFYMKSADEMAKIFGTEPRLLSNTVMIAEKVEDFLKPGGMRLPVFNIERAVAEHSAATGMEYGTPEQGERFVKEIEAGDAASVGEIKSSNETFEEAFAFLSQLAQEGMKRKKWDQSEIHITTLQKELNDVRVAWEMNGMDFATYFLIVWDYIDFARRNGIITGCGRGSGYASVLLHCLGICYGVDPMRYSLLWERFLSFDWVHMLLDSDWGFGETEEVAVSVDDIASDDIDDDRAVEDDQGGTDRY